MLLYVSFKYKIKKKVNRFEVSDSQTVCQATLVCLEASPVVPGDFAASKAFAVWYQICEGEGYYTCNM